MSVAKEEWFTLDKKMKFVGWKDSSLHEWRNTYFFIDRSMVPVERTEVLVWKHDHPGGLTTTPTLTKEEVKLHNLCKKAELPMRPYLEMVLVLGNVSQNWPYADRVPYIMAEGHGTGRVKFVLLIVILDIINNVLTLSFVHK